MSEAANHLYDVLRHVLPYGLWTLADGRQVLFDRDYRAMWVRHPGEQATAADPSWWVPCVGEQWLFDDGCAPWFAHDARAPVVFRRRGEAAERRCWRVLEAFLRGRDLPMADFDESTWPDGARRPRARWRDRPAIVPSRRFASEPRPGQ